MAATDSNRVIRLLPLVTGSLGFTLILINRILTPALSNSQARSDVLGTILSALLVLIGLLWQQIQPRNPDAVVLEGEELFAFAEGIPESVQIELAWASYLLLTNTVTRSLIVFFDGQVYLRRGVFPAEPTVVPGNILKRVQSKQKAIYLVDLKLYPGRTEFSFFPANTQGLICQPLGDRGVLILGANAPRSYTKQDEAWIQGLAEKINLTLQSAITNS
ncbi:MAG: cofactor assembly of complex C subunit B [Cyanobacteria bacterium P01_H01_bin.15]